MLIIGKKLSPYALLSISGLLAASDQAVKWLVQQSMAYGEYVSVTPFFNWVHLWNTGAAFSLFANGGGWQRYFFIGIAVVVSIFLIKLILENRHKGEAIAYSLILGGAMGNLSQSFPSFLLSYHNRYQIILTQGGPHFQDVHASVHRKLYYHKF